MNLLKSFFNPIRDKFYALSVIMIIIFIVSEISKISIFLMQYDFNLNPISALAVPAEINTFLKKPWSIFTYIFVHENIFHLFINLFFFLIVRNLYLKSNREFKIITIFFLSGISVIGLMLWFGMPNIQQAFKPVEVISVTITLNNKCSVDDNSFAVTVPGTDIIFPFKKGVARYRLKSDRKVQLISNPKYKSVRYVGIHVPVEKKMILEADCSTSPRLKGIFGSMKNQFKN